MFNPTLHTTLAVSLMGVRHPNLRTGYDGEKIEIELWRQMVLDGSVPFKHVMLPNMAVVEVDKIVPLAHAPDDETDNRITHMIYFKKHYTTLDDVDVDNYENIEYHVSELLNDGWQLVQYQPRS